MSLAFDPNAGLIVVPTRVTGPAGDVIVRMALDTGATITTISWDVMVLLGYDPAAQPDRARAVTASGVEYAPKAIVEQIEALQRRQQNFPVLCLNFPPGGTVDGVLGLDFFRGLRLVIDLRQGQVTVEEAE